MNASNLVMDDTWTGVPGLPPVTSIDEVARLLTRNNPRVQLKAIRKFRSYLRCIRPSSDTSAFRPTVDAFLATLDEPAFHRTALPVGHLLTLGHVLAVRCGSEEVRCLSEDVRLLMATLDKFSSVEPTNQILRFYSDVWQMRENCVLTAPLVKLLEHLVGIRPSLLETLILDLVECEDLAVAFNTSSTDSWLELCAKSPKIFQASSQILHTLLIYTRVDLKLVRLIQMFCRAVSDLCASEGKCVVVLYPVALQAMARELIAPQMAQTEILERLADLIVFDRSACLCLLTHFPRWIPRLVSNCIANGEARIISKHFQNIDG